MEIRRWLLCLFINCVIVTHLVAKPVSLNELIAAESKQKEQRTKTTKPAVSKPVKTVSLNELIAAEAKQNDKKPQSTKTVGASTGKPFLGKESSPSESRQNIEKSRFPKLLAKTPRRKSFSLKELFATENNQAKRRIENFLSKASGGGLKLHRSRFLPTLTHKPFESAESIISLARTISPLKFRKKFEIRSPLKPKKIKYSFTPRKRRNQSTKREADENVFHHRYIPLIKRIGLLVDDILSPVSGESLEPVRRRKPRRNPKLSRQNDLASSESKPQKKAAIAPTTVSPATADTEDPTSETPDSTTYTTPFSDVYTLRPDPNLPLPSSRNTSSDRRDDNGVGQRSSPALHGDIERHITRNNGSNEHNSSGRKQAYSPHYEEDSRSLTRIDKRSDGHGNGTDSRHKVYNDKADEKSEETESSTDRFVRRNDTKTKNTFQIGRETLQIPRDVRRLPGIPDNKVFIVDAEPVPPQKSSEESIFHVTNYHTGTERGTDWNGTTAQEDQRLRQVIQGMIPINELLHPNFLKQRTKDNQVVAIFDGYSVARDINGRNKLTEKSIRISPN